MKLSTTQRRILTALTAPGWAIRRDMTGRYALCEPIGRSGETVRWCYVRAWTRRGWLTDRGTAGRVYTLTDAGRARAQQERAAAPATVVTVAGVEGNN